MGKIAIAVAGVIGFILVATYALDGTGILSGIGGMMIRVLIGFSLLFVSVQIALFLDRGDHKPKTQQ